MTTEIELAAPHQNAGLAPKLEYARFLATSGLLPAQYREKPGNILWATEYGEMLGLRPMAAITGIHVIEGKPSASAALISALVRRAGHRLRVSGNDERAVAEIVRSDDPEFTYRSEWTMARARQADLAGKGTWKKYPAAMLKARAITEVARDACEEALMGMHYTPEELGAETDAEGTPVQATATRVDQPLPADPDWASRPATAAERATGHPEAAAAPERDWDEEIRLAVEVADADALRSLWRAAKAARPADVELRERIAAASKALVAAPEVVTDSHPEVDQNVVDAEVVDEPEVQQKQHAHMHVLWAKAELSREERLAVTSHLVGHDVTTSKELTADEADLLIERLRAFDAVGKAALKDQIDRWLEQYATKAAGAKS